MFDAGNPATPVDSIDIARAADVQSDRRAQLLLQADHHQRQRGVHLPAQGAAAGRDLLRHHRSGRVHERVRAARRSARSTDPSTWRFTVRSAAPAAGASRVAVTADGSGDFCTVQGAIDYVPADNTTPVTISVAAGHVSRDRRDPDEARDHHPRRGPQRVGHLVPEQRRAADPAGPDGVDGDEVARDVRRRRQQRHRHREHHAVESQPAAVDQRSVRDAARRGRRPDDRAQRDASRGCRTRC